MIMSFVHQSPPEPFSHIFDPPSHVFRENYPEIVMYILHKQQKTEHQTN